eukprot:CAMPEP_0181098850 /NCGR_PEP_ID=MMETSP1071-20121207/12348_1 /TAXON_ID=35127 /ORGANISM="Thalassiosira sp., Strain NH16" /LENGTH=216 /DNA_ID=CAMNT_0023181477 /DNA_START=227 /DNA_END=877 /DNA_ORIENTATION=+
MLAPIIAEAIGAAAALSENEDPLWSSTSTASTDPVLRLTTSTYESTVFHSGKNGMVMFYQSWCGHCIRFKPVWDELAMMADPSIFIARVDCGASADNKICRSSQITTYPTLRYFVDRTEHEYNDSLSIHKLREFVDSTLATPCNPLLDANTCSERAMKYSKRWLDKDATKIVGEMERLGKMMESSSVTAESRRWMVQRRDLLRLIHENQNAAKKEL